MNYPSPELRGKLTRKQFMLKNCQPMWLWKCYRCELRRIFGFTHAHPHTSIFNPRTSHTLVRICQNSSARAPTRFACVLFFWYFSIRNKPPWKVLKMSQKVFKNVQMCDRTPEKVPQARTLHTCLKMFFARNRANVLARLWCAKVRRNSHFENVTAYIFQIWSSHLCIHAEIQT